MSEGLRIIDHRLGALEGVARGVFGKPPGLLPPGQKKELPGWESLHGPKNSWGNRG